MASFNKVILMGNLTRDPEVRYIPSGSAVTDIGLAVNRTWFDKASNTKKEDVTFVDVTLWGRTAEIAGEYLSKGRPVLIEGRLQMDSWEDRETGQKRSKLKVIGEQMTMLGSKGDSGGGGGRQFQGGGQQQQQQQGGSGGHTQQGQQGGGYSQQQAPQSGNDSASSFYDSPPSGGAPDDEVPF
ncbi:Single-stranded DNA-binding protein [hydrothermal vent metagenome]|uniref:Single-stranded DNA-binding protein n=1 Tax=hydrothermal vent metagenome TaxID=652676 RepID=A0A3B1E072_9ZZZZ